ncbi:MAG: glycoside hydrolase family 20 zincin-like fold domain-containing protein, partial [Muribaculaceae bacterium]
MKPFHTFFSVAMLLFALSSSLLCTAKVTIGNLDVIPQPYSVTQSPQEKPFVITRNTTIVYPQGNDKMLRNAQFLASFIGKSTGITPAISSQPGAKHAITLDIDNTMTHREGYTLTVTSNAVKIVGGSEAGTFYALLTLYKALPVTIGQNTQAALPQGSVTDHPRFNYRGFMLDVGRHFYPVEYIKEVIDML